MIFKRSIIVFSMVLFLAIPCFAQSISDGSGSFNAYQQKAQQNFEQQKNMINASDDGIDAKKQTMDNRFNDMKKQFEKIYGKNMPVTVVVDGVLHEVDGIWIDPYFDVVTIKGGESF